MRTKLPKKNVPRQTPKAERFAARAEDSSPATAQAPALPAFSVEPSGPAWPVEVSGKWSAVIKDPMEHDPHAKSSVSIAFWLFVSSGPKAGVWPVYLNPKYTVPVAGFSDPDFIGVGNYACI